MKRHMAIGCMLGFVFGSPMAFLDVNGGLGGIPFVGAIADWLALPGAIVVRIVPWGPSRGGPPLEFLLLYTLMNGVFYGILGAFVGRYSWKLGSASRQDAPRCSKCGYCLIGNTSGICPECGHLVSAPPTDTEKAL